MRLSKFLIDRKKKMIPSKGGQASQRLEPTEENGNPEISEKPEEELESTSEKSKV